MDIQGLDKFENILIKKHKQGTGQIVSRLTDKEFKDMLLQRRWISYAFTPQYDLAIDGMQNEKAKRISREIRNEEYPAKGPSHREDLMSDLMVIGLPLEKIINSNPTKETLRVLRKQFELLRINESPELHDIKVLAHLRFSLEVLVSVEYGIFAKRLEKMGLTQRNSKFYWPHYLHDMKKMPLGSEGSTHSDAMSKILAEMLDTNQKIKFCKKITEKSYKLRTEAFKQFKK